MREHCPPIWLAGAMAIFFYGVAVTALGLWILVAVAPSGITGVAALLGIAGVSLILALHIPAGISGLLLWQWYRDAMPPRMRAVHETATVYFGASVGVFLAANAVGMAALEAMA